MTSPKDFRIDGIVPIIPTPFHPDEEIDFDALGDLVEFAIAGGAWGVCLPAFASEFYKLSEQERQAVVLKAVEQARGRLPVIAQVNYPAARLAARVAAEMQQAGASAINVAVPRLFALPEPDLARYFGRILDAIEVPLVIQDFNPGGPSVSVEFIRDLHRAHSHFRYVKLEEPLMGAKTEAILEATSGEVGVIEGWGGMYMLELMPSGICGVMPSLGLVDLLARVFGLARNGRRDEAFAVFQGILPQIVFSLEHMEVYHHVEKSLLADRGVLREANVRAASVTPRPHVEEYTRFVNGGVLALLDRLGMPRNPAKSGTVAV